MTSSLQGNHNDLFKTICRWIIFEELILKCPGVSVSRITKKCVRLICAYLSIVLINVSLKRNYLSASDSCIIFFKEQL